MIAYLLPRIIDAQKIFFLPATTAAWSAFNVIKRHSNLFLRHFLYQVYQFRQVRSFQIMAIVEDPGRISAIDARIHNNYCITWNIFMDKIPERDGAGGFVGFNHTSQKQKIDDYYCNDQEVQSKLKIKFLSLFMQKPSTIASKDAKYYWHPQKMI